MRIAHLILAHKAPAQLGRLLRALAHPDADTFIHLDKKNDIQPFAALAELPNVQFTKTRLNVQWGGYSLTQAALEGMREILQAPESYDFINLISGEDYPIKPMSAIHEFLAQHVGHSFMECEGSTGSAWWQANWSRISEYHFTEIDVPGRYVIQRWLNRVLPPRKPPFAELYGSGMGGWYTLSPECAAYAIAFVDSNPWLRRYALFSWGTDEYLLHSILLNSSHAANITTTNNLRYIDWSLGGASPKSLTIADLPSLRASSRLFARKFDSSRDEVVLDQLDLLNQHQH